MSYDREKAVAYAHRWAYGFNPAYGNFTDMGGDCTNFLSQCLHAGGLPMNYRPVTGWFYNSLSSRAPAWTGVNELYRFLVSNTAAGPVAEEVPLSRIESGDIIQLATEHPYFHHGVIVVHAGSSPSPENILIACHSYDVDYRPLAAYHILQQRCLHITHVNT